MSSITTFRDEGCVLEEDRAKILADLEKSTESAAEKCADNETLLAATLKILEQLKSGSGNILVQNIILELKYSQAQLL